MKTDILIAGSGCSGLYCALQLPRDKKITIITKSDLTSNDSSLAQGGVVYGEDNGYFCSSLLVKKWLGGAHFTDVVNWLSKFKKTPGS